MKSIKLITAALLALSPLARADDPYYESSRDRDLQLGAVMLAPYQVSSPEGRTAMLFGVNGELFPDPNYSLGLEAIFGVEDRGFDENPVYLTPGISFYPRGYQFAIFEPIVKVEMPILVNTDNRDIGARGGLGFMVNVGQTGLALKYTFDAGYYFDSDRTELNLAHVGAVYNF